MPACVGSHRGGEGDGENDDGDDDGGDDGGGDGGDDDLFLLEWLGGSVAAHACPRGIAPHWLRGVFLIE